MRADVYVLKILGELNNDSILGGVEDLKEKDNSISRDGCVRVCVCCFLTAVFFWRCPPPPPAHAHSLIADQARHVKHTHTQVGHMCLWAGRGLPAAWQSREATRLAHASR